MRDGWNKNKQCALFMCIKLSKNENEKHFPQLPKLSVDLFTNILNIQDIEKQK